MPGLHAWKKGCPALERPADRRAAAYRIRARELIEAAWRTNDIGRKQHLFDLAKTYQRTADVMAPLPPDEPEVFHSTK